MRQRNGETYRGYTVGQQYRVTRPGAHIDYMEPTAPSAWQGARRDLQEGDVITFLGTSMTFGDGVPAMKWGDAEGQPLGGDAIFHPNTGGMWGGQVPADGYLEPVDA